MCGLFLLCNFRESVTVCENKIIVKKSKKKKDTDIRLYRDDGLAVLNHAPKKKDKVKKEICTIITNNNLRITIEANKTTVNFLDVTLYLATERFKPYSKPATTPLYAIRRSNHPA